MGVMYYILSPFSWLLNFFYSFTDSYGISLILFALVIKIILFPLTIKGKKGMIQMNLLSGKMQQLQKQYGKDRERYNMEVQRLYEREKVNPMSGCLWSFLPILILLPLYAIIRQPLLYLMGLDSNQIAQVAASVDWQTLAVNHGWVTADAMAKLVEQFNAGEIATVFQNVGYNQLYLASLVNENTLPAITAALGEGTRVFVMNFDFLGLDLAMLPTWKIWEHLNWQYIGAFLLIVISAFSSIFMSKISMKTNQMNNQPKSCRPRPRSVPSGSARRKKRRSAARRRPAWSVSAAWKRRRKTVAKRSPARRRATPISLASERATAGWGCGPMPGAVPMIPTASAA